MGIVDEMELRISLFNKVKDSVGLVGISPQLLTDLGIYKGQAGIWRDAERTRIDGLAPEGISVSLLHTGEHYPDDLTEKTLIYHYPKTDRSGYTDENEVEATKAANRFSIPVFVITTNKKNPSLRNLLLGYVRSWDDNREIFEIELTDHF